MNFINYNVKKENDNKLNNKEYIDDIKIKLEEKIKQNKQLKDDLSLLNKSKMKLEEDLKEKIKKNKKILKKTSSMKS